VLEHDRGENNPAASARLPSGKCILRFTAPAWEGFAVDAREQKGMVLAATRTITRKGDNWLVPSHIGHVKYEVHLDPKTPTCTCPDHETTGGACKHIHAARFVSQRDLFDFRHEPPTELFEATSKPTYRQDWPAYNAAQVNEKTKFQSMLRDLCSRFEEPPRQGRGRPRIPLADAIFAAVFKVYSTVSGRRFMCDLCDARDKGYIKRMPCYNSIFGILESPATTDMLLTLITESAQPLKAVETNFACDSSGFSASRFDRWFEHKWKQVRIQRAWVKCHIMCGVKTNIITAVEIHGQYTADTTQLPNLLASTARRFKVNEVSADLAYSSHDNLLAVALVGGKPMIPFKKNVTPKQGGLWAKMYHYFHLHREEFLKRYHLRSNVETTFHMLKSKFGDGVRSKCDVAMKNEVLCKILGHNLCCLIQALYELGIDPVFWEQQQTAAG
jgi:Transposase